MIISRRTTPSNLRNKWHDVTNQVDKLGIVMVQINHQRFLQFVTIIATRSPEIDQTDLQQCHYFPTWLSHLFSFHGLQFFEATRHDFRYESSLWCDLFQNVGQILTFWEKVGCNKWNQSISLSTKLFRV